MNYSELLQLAKGWGNCISDRIIIWRLPLKEWLVEPIYRAIDEMMRGHWFQLNDNYKKILRGAINRTVDRMVDMLDIGSKIEDNVRENMPSENQIEQEVHREIRRRGR